MIAALLSDLLPYLAGVVALIAALFGYGARQRSNGRKQERKKSKEDDYENANDIRDRVERDLSERVRKYDDAGFRD